jgi:hypothetical protein
VIATTLYRALSTDNNASLLASDLIETLRAILVFSYWSVPESGAASRIEHPICCVRPHTARTRRICIVQLLLISLFQQIQVENNANVELRVY